MKKQDKCCANTAKPNNDTGIVSCCSNKASSVSCCGHGSNKSTEKKSKAIIRQAILLGISFIALVLGFFNWHKIGVLIFYYINPSWVAIVLCGTPIFKNAIKALSNKKITAALLISIAIVASIALEIISFFVTSASGHGHSYIFAAGEVAFLMAIGGIIEDITVRKTRSGISRLIDLIPKTANVKTAEGLVVCSLEEIQLDDIVVAKAGEMIAVDGVIISGASSVDQSSVTGEYLPMDKSIGDTVYGGTFNSSGVIEIKVTKLLEDMTVAKMAELVEEAEGRKAPISRVADKWASFVVPIAAFLAVVIGLIVFFVLKDFNTALVRAVTVLVVFCPCALALATPTAIAAGIGSAAKRGVLVKSGQALEALSHVDTLCFDKTGTLTKGEIVLDNIMTTSASSKEEVLRLMASVESYSEHPLGKAIIKAAKDMALSEPKNVVTTQGIGIEANVGELSIKIYNYGHAKSKGYMEEELDAFALDEMDRGKTVVVCIIQEKLKAVVSFSDTIRENTASIIEKITARGYDTIMLTGDNEASANYIGNKVGIKNIKHSLLPADKQNIISMLQQKGKKVCMFGDGINDAPSLKLADCGIAMGALDNDLAIETADMAILNSGMSKVSHILSLSKKVLKTIKRNIIIAMSINFAAILLSAFGVLTPVTGAIVHNFTSILVVLNSALLLKK